MRSGGCWRTTTWSTPRSDRLEKLGRDELARLQDQFKRTAALIDSHRLPEEVFQALSSQHPEPSKLIATASAGLAQLRAFVIEHHIATIESAQQPLVRETPPYARATTFASMDTPGPLEKKVLAAYFYVTLPDPSWPPKRTEQLLAFFSSTAISNTSVHEVYPGHFVQFLDDRDNPDLVRSLFSSGANIEGWAFYCEQMMLDEGLHRRRTGLSPGAVANGAAARVPLPGGDRDAYRFDDGSSRPRNSSTSTPT